MKTLKPLVLSFSLLAFAGAAHAAGNDASKGATGATSGATDKESKYPTGSGTVQYEQPKTFSELDQDNDGNIGRMEAAADPDAKSNFAKIDKNNDYKISRQEWEAAKGGATAGAGATAGEKGGAKAK